MARWYILVPAVIYIHQIFNFYLAQLDGFAVCKGSYIFFIPLIYTIE